MNRLASLIHHIENPSRVSNEDVFDTVRQYWDDVTKGYWNDVDEDLAEELGVTPTALSELLEVHRHTFDYANVGGNSSVRGYDHGEDWMVVMFSDGSRYLYTTKSTTPESIGWMKKLAAEGKGLNSYIMRLQRLNYAGRNVRGDILIKPGMESYNPEGYKRLQLIEAFRNTMKENISNEGIFDSLKSLFGKGKPENANTPVQPTPKQYVSVWERAASIEKSPPKELGSVSSDSLIFQTNGQYNPNWIGRLSNDLKQYSRITKEIFAEDKKVAVWASKWDAKIDDFLGDADRGDEFLHVVKAWVASQPQPWATKFRNSYDFIGWGKDNWTTENHNNGFGYMPLTTGGRVQVPEQNAMVTSKIIKMVSELGNIILETLSEDLTWVSYDFTDSPFRGYVYETPGVDDALNEMKYHSDAFVSPRDHYDVLQHRLEDLLSDLVEYVENAMKVSTGIEGYKHRTLKCYRDQIICAGTDGLDPTARAIMKVGLESMDIDTRISMESIDVGEPPNETISLKAVIDSYCEASDK